MWKTQLLIFTAAGLCLGYSLPLPMREQYRIRVAVVYSLGHVQLFTTPWTVARQAPLSIGFLRQEYWSGLPFPSSRDLPDPGLQPTFPALVGRFFTTEPPGKLDIRISWLFKINVL